MSFHCAFLRCAFIIISALVSVGICHLCEYVLLLCPSVWSVAPKFTNVDNISSAGLYPFVAPGQFLLLLFPFVLQTSLCEVALAAPSSLPQRSFFSESATHGAQHLKQWLNKHRDTAWGGKQQQQQQSRVLQQKWWSSWHSGVGGVSGRQQPVREEQRHSLTPAPPFVGEHPSLLSSTLSFCMVSIVTASEAWVWRGSRKDAQCWQGWRGYKAMNEHNGCSRIGHFGWAVMKSPRAWFIGRRMMLCHHGKS